MEAHERGILTATTLMANGNAFGHAVELAHRTPSLDVGCHLVMVQGYSVLEPSRKLPATLKELLSAWAGREIRPLQEARAQVKKILENLNAGKGTAGKLLNDDEVYRQLNLIAAKVTETIDKINAGQGTIGQLVVNPQLYESLNMATLELDKLVQDVRANPKKFLSIKLVLF